MALAKRGQILTALAVATEEAFAGVTLGSGVGLLEASGMDDYASEEKMAQYRVTDEKLSWKSIAADRLNQYSGSLSYFDAEGMRFHLPAFLISDMQGLFGFDLQYSLTQSTCMEEKFSLLSNTQREVVRRYLEFIAEGDEFEHDRDHIQRALSNYWAR